MFWTASLSALQVLALEGNHDRGLRGDAQAPCRAESPPPATPPATALATLASALRAAGTLTDDRRSHRAHFLQRRARHEGATRAREVVAVVHAVAVVQSATL